MYVSETTIRVRYAETDQMGYVYYGNYAAYYEIARVEALRNLGLRYKTLEENEGIMMPVLENYSKYIRPARYDELLKIVVKIPKRPGTRTRFEYEIYNEADELIHIGHTVLVFVTIASGRPCNAPESFLKLLDPFFPHEAES
jgi:acyl-CoA thioester hydrolase